MKEEIEMKLESAEREQVYIWEIPVHCQKVGHEKQKRKKSTVYFWQFSLSFSTFFGILKRSLLVALSSQRKYWINEVTNVVVGVVVVVWLLWLESLAFRRRCFRKSSFEKFVRSDKSMWRDGGKEIERFVGWYLVRSVSSRVCLLEQMLLLRVGWLIDFVGGRRVGNWSTKVKVSMSFVQNYIHMFIIKRKRIKKLKITMQIFVAFFFLSNEICQY